MFVLDIEKETAGAISFHRKVLYFLYSNMLIPKRAYYLVIIKIY